MSLVVNNLCRAGEEIIIHARDPNRQRYTDQTGNLTSSIGYAVIWDGQIVVQSDFEPVRGKLGSLGVDGSKQGEKFLQQLIKKNGRGIVLIAVAGMPYAAYVEAMGKDVLVSAEIKANEIVKRLLSKLKF